MKALRIIALPVTALAATSLPASGGEGGGDLGKALLTPHIGTFVWVLITFLIMVAILGKYAWRPLLDVIAAREKSIEDAISQSRRDRDDAASALAEHRELIAQARRERAEAAAAGQRDAEKIRTEMLDEARRQREQMLKQTEEQVETAVRQAKSDLRGYAADLSIAAAGKLLGRNLDDDAQRRVVTDYLEDLEKTGGSPQLPS